MRPIVPFLTLLAACGPTLAPDVDQLGFQRERVVTTADGPVVALDVLVTDADGLPVACDAGMVDATVTMIDGGQRTPIGTGRTTVTCGAGTPPDVTMVLDNSGSQEEVLTDTREGARALAHQVLDAGGRVGLVRISTFSRPLLDLSADATAVDEALDGMFVNRGWTALWDAVRMGNEVLQAGRTPGQALTLQDACALDAAAELVVFTNGVDNNSAQEQLVGDDDDGVATTLDDLLHLTVDGAPTPVHTIGLGRNVDEAALTQLAAQTGGGHVAVSLGEQLPQAFDLVAGWTTQDRRVCATLPEPTCGPVDVEVAWTLTAPADPDPCADGLGDAADFDVVALGDFTNSTDVEGRALVGGTATLSAFSIGSRYGGGDALICGDLVATNGQVWGNGVYARTASVSGNVNFLGGSLRQDSPVDMAAVDARAHALSAGLATLPATGTANVLHFGPTTLITLTGTRPDVEVFALDVTDLAGLASLTVNTVPGATVIVNVTGRDIALQNLGVTLTGADTHHLLWNAPDARTWTTTSIGWKGTILAPDATITVNNGNLDGTAVGRTVGGTGEWHHHLFTGTTSCPDACASGGCTGAVVSSGIDLVSVDVPCPTP